MTEGDKPEGGDVIQVDFAAKREGPLETTLTPRRKPNSLYERVILNGKEVSCAHAKLVIDETTLDLECQDCESKIDHRLFVMEWARRQRMVRYSREEVARLNKEAADLKREISNLKAQVRRARGKVLDELPQENLESLLRQSIEMKRKKR